MSIVAVVGLGYVGLPLAAEFGKQYDTIGYDLSAEKIDSYRRFCDPTGEVSTEALRAATRLKVTTDPAELARADFIIVAVPTPVDEAHIPDFSPLVSSSTTVGKHMKRGATVVYESTVYPGATEEVCIPILEKHSDMKWMRDFHVGYSPERVNPGDKEHTITRILKVTSGSTPEAAARVDGLYRSVITAGTHLASSIRVAEAAKVIENSQRDINIAFVNELAMIFNLMGIDTHEVLAAAGTKWNFLPFRPGLVGGHCIGVDPYYLAQKAQEYGYHPEIILAGRRLNDNMGRYVASEVIRLMIARDLRVKGARVLMLGVTFKENCPDIRNTRAVDIVRELRQYGTNVDIFDPWANPGDVRHEYGMECIAAPVERSYDVVILAVAHQAFAGMEIRSFCSSSNAVVYDVKGVLNTGDIDGRL